MSTDLDLEPNPDLDSDPSLDSDSATRCPYCDRRFATEDRAALHGGIDHADRLDGTERAAYERAAEAEAATVRRFKLTVVLALVGIYFGFLFVYAIVAFS
ncbi:DUF7410 domain-containing protein [Halomontanus rarus]|uniref:DUF7410 domain-containing protein n=1 Tax=Halomontanus rarus TaxID=3034020 RepID=UPI0023E7B322|nr:hypothetical protein [Halovivax sp. TS33]